MKKNVAANFWIRLLARIVDLLLFGIITILISLPNISFKNNINFKSPLNFYIWSIFSIITIIFLFLIMPIITKGFTIGMFILRIKIIFDLEKPIRSLLNREMVFSILWIFNLIFLTIIINHSLIEKILKKNIDKNLSLLENFRIGIYSSINSIAFFIQWIFAISIIIRKNNEGLHDKFSKTKTVFINKYEIIYNANKEINSFSPYLIENKIVEWVGE